MLSPCSSADPAKRTRFREVGDGVPPSDLNTPANSTRICRPGPEFLWKDVTIAGSMAEVRTVAHGFAATKSSSGDGRWASNARLARNAFSTVPMLLY